MKTKRCGKHDLEFKGSYGANVRGGNIVEHRCRKCGAKILTNGFTGKRISSTRPRPSRFEQ